MATVTVTFLSAFPGVGAHTIGNIANGRGARSERIETATDGTGTGTLTATASETVITIMSDGDVWVAIGETSDPSDNGGIRAAHLVRADTYRDFAARAGDTVAVETV